MRRGLTALSVWACLMLGAARAGDAVTVLLDDFDNVGSGTKWVVVGVQGHDLKPEVAGLASEGHDGKACARVTVGAGAALTVRQEFGKAFVGNGDKECLILPGTPSKLGLWVRGNHTPTALSVQFTGIVLEKRKKKEKGEDVESVEETVRGKDVDYGTLDFDGWKFVERDVPVFDKPPVRLGALRLDASKVPEAKDPAILLDDLTLTTQGTGEAPCHIVYERLGLEKELAAGDPFTVRLSIQNLLPRKRNLKVDVDVTTGKTAVMSHAETLKSTVLDVELAPGESKSWKFEYQYGAGIYNGHLTILDAATREMLADRRIEYAVFPKADHSLGRDFRVYNSGLSPLVLLHNAGPRLFLFQGFEPYGLAGPAHVAFVTPKGMQLAAGGQELGVAEMSEAWMLFWFSGAAGWDKLSRPPYPVDVPMLVVFEHKPREARPAGSGWEFTFARECGHVALMPLYGVSYVRAAATAGWEKGLSEDVIERCRLLTQVSREYPLSVEEKFKVDPVRDVVTVRNRFEFLSLDDDWGTPHRKVAPLEYLTALVNRHGWKSLAVQGKLLDLDVPVGQGLFAGVEGADETTYTLSGLLKYVNLLEQPKRIPQDDPLLAEARGNFDARNVLWHRFHNSWWAEENLACAGNAGHVFPYLSEDAQRYVRVAGQAVAAFTLNPNNLVFEYDAAKGASFALDGQNYERMGWCDANATSNEGLRAAYRYTVGTGDRELVKRRWPFIRSYYNVPLRMSHWGDSGFNAGGGDTFGSNLNGAICFARMACWVGDDASYKFACCHTAKQLVALYGACVAYPKWVLERNLWGTLQETFEARDENGRIALFGRDVRKDKSVQRLPVALEDIPFTDLRGGNLGLVPWCMVQRTSDSQERFLKDHAPEYSRYMLDGLPKKWLPQWHQAVYVEQAKAPDVKQLGGPSWLSDSVGPSITPNLSGWDFVFDTPRPERRAKLEKFYRNNGGVRGREFEIILAGLEQEYKPLWEGEAWTPRADDRFRDGFDRIAATAWSPAVALATPKFKWPTLGWLGLSPPQQPQVNSLGLLPLCGLAPDDRKISFAATSESPNRGLSVWAADYLNYPVLTFAADLEKLPLYLRSLVIERGLDRAQEHVRAMLAQGELEWNVCGPFPYLQASDFDKAWPPEEKLDLAADYGVQKIGRDYAVKWKKAKARTSLVDLNSLYEPNQENYVQNAQVYAAIWVKCPEERDMKIALGSDDGAKAWVNGSLVWRNWVHRGTVMDQDVFPIHLKKGWNAVLLKVFNRTHGCGFEFCLRFVDDKLLPYGDLEFGSAPPTE